MKYVKFLILLLILVAVGCQGKPGIGQRTVDSLATPPKLPETAKVIKPDTTFAAQPAASDLIAPSGLKLESARVPFAGKFSEDDPAEYTLGITAYKADSFAVAADYLRSATRVQKLDWQIWFYRGISEYYSGNMRDAIHSLSTVEKLGPHPSYERKARWFLANAYLMENNVDRSERILGSIVAQGADYKSEAADLLARVKALPDSVRKKGG